MADSGAQTRHDRKIEARRLRNDAPQDLANLPGSQTHESDGPHANQRRHQTDPQALPPAVPHPIMTLPYRQHKPPGSF